MNGRAQSILVLLVGVALLRIALFTQLYLRYVKAGLRWPLVAAGVVLVVAAAVTLVRDLIHTLDDAHDDGHGHGPGGPLVAWLLVLPVFAILLIGPPALGSYSVDRSGRAAVAEPAGAYPPLPPGDPVRVPLLDFVSRVAWQGGASARGRTLRLTGFITTGQGGRIYLTRIVITCCAADGQALRIALAGDVPTGLTPDTWVTVTGRYEGGRSLDPVSRMYVPMLTVATLQQIPAPAEPYDG